MQFSASRAGAGVVTGSTTRPSVLVRDLIAASVFESADGFSALRPAVSIILPTFRRGDSGMLETTIVSVLAQTFADFELIIVDDGSTDSTRRIVQEHMASDVRVSTIRHPVNVGLPAVSSYEAVVASRASKIFFTFDDNTLETDALETMMTAAAEHPEARFLYGEVLSVFPGQNRVDGDAEFSRELLYEHNIIPNGAVLIDREVFDRCGLYDPHVAMTRLCDWDLWIRVSREFEIHHVPKVIATELGRSQSDSIGNTHVWDRALVAEWMSVDRSPRLRPDAILDYDVADIPDTMTRLSSAKVETLVDRFFGTSPSAQDSGYTVVVCDGFSQEILDVFEPNSVASRVVGATYFQLNVLGFWDLLAAARTVVFVGSVRAAESVAGRLRTVGKGYDYYLPDDADGVDVPDHIAHEFFAGAQRILRRGSRAGIRSAAANEIELLRDGSMAELTTALDRADWTETSIRDLPYATETPNVLEVIGMVDRLVQATPRELTEIVPEGYYTPQELVSRVTQRLRRRPLSVFRLVGNGVKSVLSR